MLTRRDAIAGLGAGALTGAAALQAARAAEPDALRLRDLYVDSTGVTPLARRLDGRPVAVDGHMAPPLRAGAEFFVITRTPTQYCPFCEGEEWTGDFLVAYADRPVRVAPGWRRVRARGLLRIGQFRDEDTGFYSPLRLESASWAHV